MFTWFSPRVVAGIASAVGTPSCIRVLIPPWAAGDGATAGMRWTRGRTTSTRIENRCASAEVGERIER